MQDAIAIISKWPSRQALADDIGGTLAQVHSWVKRNRIAPEHDVAIVTASDRRGLGVTYEMLARSRSLNDYRQSAHVNQDAGAA